MTIHCYAAHDAKKSLEKYEYKATKLGAQDVEIKITHCGICHSDVHLIDNDWGISIYPLVPGHEIVGTVSTLGSEVRNLSTGQRVGVGWQRAACLTCDTCIRGDENLCDQQQATCVGFHGGFADRIVTDSRFVFPIPDGLASENAAPLLCGGVTVYSPLYHFGVKPTSRVGIIGIGGLGHLAIQFASKFGCEVTAFSSSKGKEKEALGFGARHFVSSTDESAMDDLTGYFDFIINTAHADLDWEAYLETLKPNGTFCFVGVPPSPVTVAVFPLISGRKSICGSPIGGRSHILDMLHFAERHKIAATTEVVPMSEANFAIDRVRKNQARYRMVLKA